MKKCNKCNYDNKEYDMFCANCGTALKKKKNNILIISICVVAMLVLLILIKTFFNYKNDYKKENDKNWMIYDAKTFLTDAMLQKLTDNDVKCLQIYGTKGKYHNSGNYVGSIDVTKDDYYIWLSDGNYYVNGTYDNLKITESKLTATKKCSLYE